MMIFQVTELFQLIFLVTATFLQPYLWRVGLIMNVLLCRRRVIY